MIQKIAPIMLFLRITLDLNGEAIEYGTRNYYVKDVVSNFPAQYEQLEVNKQMKEFAQYDTGFRPVMK